VTQEIVDAVKALETEKGIDADTLMDALADALLSAYKKTPGAAKYAKVELDHGTADFRVFEIKVPDDLEQRLLDEQFEEQLQIAEAAEAAGEPVPEIQQTGPTVDPETGERREAREDRSRPPVGHGNGPPGRSRTTRCAEGTTSREARSCCTRCTWTGGATGRGRPRRRGRCPAPSSGCGSPSHPAP
jgi:hypothetical protein